MIWQAVAQHGRIYEGQTGPLLRAFLTPLAVKADDYHTVYSGSNQNSSSYTNSVQNADTSKIKGNAICKGAPAKMQVFISHN